MTPLPDAETSKVLRSFQVKRVIFPILLGLAAVAWLFYTQFDAQQFREIRWTWAAFAWIGISLVLLLLRHLSYSFRLRALTGKIFSWKKYFQLIVMWEFSAALTPTSKGGPFVMLFVLTKERLSAGRTAAAVFYTLICDSGFFVLMLPFLLLMYGPRMLYPGIDSYSDARLASGAFFVTYGMMCAYWLVLLFFVFIRPDLATRVTAWLARIRFFKKYEQKLMRLGTEFSLAAAEMRSNNWRYHSSVILGTIGAWTSKFIMINCLIIAVAPDIPVDGGTQLFIFARLVAMFIIMAFSPTPGGAGLAELALAGFLADFIPQGIGLVVALLWRGMAYYGYLLAGAFIVPAWLSTHWGQPKTTDELH
jgi:glycosyltransferase 2 family protein